MWTYAAKKSTKVNVLIDIVQCLLYNEKIRKNADESMVLQAALSHSLANNAWVYITNVSNGILQY